MYFLFASQKSLKLIFLVQFEAFLIICLLGSYCLKNLVVYEFFPWSSLMK